LSSRLTKEVYNYLDGSAVMGRPRRTFHDQIEQFLQEPASVYEEFDESKSEMCVRIVASGRSDLCLYLMGNGRDLHTYHSRFIPKGSRDISESPPRRPRFTKII
jgi:hypothetical protein